MHHAEPAPQTFQDLPLGRRTLWSLDQIGYVTPTPIQAQFIPVAITGVDVIGQAQTGTGKTAAFLLPILEQLRSEPPDPQALVLAPTRELAAQIQAEGSRLADGRGISLISLCGGHSMRNQIEDLRHGCQIAIGTPGRVLHHLRTGELRVQDVRHVVLDEADRMLDIGFRPDIEKILRQLPRVRQTLLLSATMPAMVRKLAERYMQRPRTVEIPAERLTVDSIKQSHFVVERDRRLSLLFSLIEREQPGRCIIFCRRKRDADELAAQLGHQYAGVDAMHGDLEQNKRNRVLESFRTGKTRFLVCTDLVGRGIDVDDISHVINYDIPEDPENYVHRIGRTARMGKNGIAFTLVTPAQGKELTAIEIFINHEIPKDSLEGFQGARRAEAAKPTAPRLDFGHGRTSTPTEPAPRVPARTLPPPAPVAESHETRHAAPPHRAVSARHPEDEAPRRHPAEPVRGERADHDAPPRHRDEPPSRHRDDAPPHREASARHPEDEAPRRHHAEPVRGARADHDAPPRHRDEAPSRHRDDAPPHRAASARHPEDEAPRRHHAEPVRGARADHDAPPRHRDEAPSRHRDDAPLHRASSARHHEDEAPRRHPVEPVRGARADHDAPPRHRDEAPSRHRDDAPPHRASSARHHEDEAPRRHHAEPMRGPRVDHDAPPRHRDEPPSRHRDDAPPHRAGSARHHEDEAPRRHHAEPSRGSRADYDAPPRHRDEPPSRHRDDAPPHRASSARHHEDEAPRRHHAEPNRGSRADYDAPPRHRPPAEREPLPHRDREHARDVSRGRGDQDEYAPHPRASRSDSHLPPPRHRSDDSEDRGRDSSEPSGPPRRRRSRR